MQALLPATYLILNESYGLSFEKVGLLTLTQQFSASLLKPVVGVVTDRRPRFILSFRGSAYRR